MRYIDALFQATSSMALCGLNTVALNQLKTYQQIFLAIMPLLAHPLTTSSALVYYRLHLFRKKFEDIESLSKTQSKMRRAITYSQYEASKFRDRDARDSPSGRTVDADLNGRRETPGPLKRFYSALSSERHFRAPRVRHGSAISVSSAASLNGEKGDNGSVTSDVVSTHVLPRPGQHIAFESPAAKNSESESSENSSKLENSMPNLVSTISSTELRRTLSNPKETHNQGAAEANTEDENKIRFGDLPKPSSADPRTHDPREMFRSLNMMRSRYQTSEVDEQDGPALVIKSPRDIEADEKRGIHSAVVEDDGVGHHRPRHFRRMSTLSNMPSSGTGSVDPRTLAPIDRSHSMTTNYLSWAPTVGRNSAFVNLTKEQKEELGGIEYRALRVLRFFILFHFVTIIALGFLFTVPWVYARKTYDEIIRSNGVSPVLFGMTTVLFAFNNNGLCVLPSSMAPFWDTAYLPLVMSFVAMLGGALVPLMLRFYIWTVFHLSPRFGRTRETLGFLLDHPRRCYLYLFPSTTTWWLALTLFAFHLTEISFFMILNRGSHNPVPYEHADRRFLAAFFQSAMTRTTGLSIIDLTTQHPAMLILNVVSMYLAIYPQAMTIRKSNVYEDQSLGRFKPETEKSKKLPGDGVSEDGDDYDEEDESPGTLVELLRRQFSLDAWSLTLSLFFVSITEGGAISRQKFTLFEIIFEVISAHGTVGFSLGYGDASTSAGFSTLGKLIMIILIIRSAHRGMPYSIDRAVILRGKEMNRRDKEQENRLRNTHVWYPRTVTSSSRLPSLSTAFSSVRRRNTMSSNP